MTAKVHGLDEGIDQASKRISIYMAKRKRPTATSTAASSREVDGLPESKPSAVFNWAMQSRRGFSVVLVGPENLIVLLSLFSSPNATSSKIFSCAVKPVIFETMVAGTKQHAARAKHVHAQ